jgi:formylmethanofuran dehydrogenase subunit E
MEGRKMDGFMSGCLMERSKMDVLMGEKLDGRKKDEWINGYLETRIKACWPDGLMMNVGCTKGGTG